MFSVAIASLLIGQSALSVADWSVHSNHHLEWSGDTYVPVGVRIGSSPAEINRVAKAGITDVTVDLPLEGLNWAPTIQALESNNLNYFISINSIAPSAEVVAIQPESYRIPNLSGDIDLEIPLPGVKSAYVVLASQRTSAPRFQGVVQAQGGKINFKYNRPVNADHVLIIYPIINDLSTPDFWEKFDTYRDTLLTKLSSTQFGPGYRGLMNPFGKVVKFMPAKAGYVPTSPFFRMELESFLNQKYGTVSTALMSWGLSANGIQDYSDLSKVVPLWSESRGLAGAWDGTTDRMIRAERSGTTMWSDIRQVMYSSAVRRYGRLVDSVKQATGRPVIQDWEGWTGPYESISVHVDGIGFSCQPTSVVNVIDEAGRPMSSALRQTKPTILLASNIDLTGENQNLPISDIITSTMAMGCRGWFFRVQTDEQLANIATLSKLMDGEPARNAPIPEPLFYPEASRNPAATAPLYGNRWWLPAPGAGRILDFGEGIEGYQYDEDGRRVVAFWSVTEPRRMKFKLQEPKAIVFTPLDGSDLDIRIRRKDLEMTVPTSPVVIYDPPEIPVPVDSFNITVAMVDALLTRFGSKIDITGTARYKANNIIKAFDRDPGNSFVALREQWRDLLLGAAPYVWLEAENSPQNTFSSIKTIPGASGERVLTLSSKIPSLSGEYQARYQLPSRFPGNYEIWISGNIPEAIKPHLRVNIGNQQLSFDSQKVGFYGADLGWYKLGNVELSQDDREFSIICSTTIPTELQLDTIMISPTPFFPSGSKPPIAWLLDGLGQEPPRLKTD